MTSSSDGKLKLSPWALASLTLICAVLLIYSAALAFGLSCQVVVGKSMEPTLYHGDLVITQRTSSDLIAHGDVIVYLRDDTLIVHRVVAKYSDGEVYFVTKGDNVPHPDPPVPASAVIGKVIQPVPKVGFLKLWLDKPIAGGFTVGMAAILALVALLLYDCLAWRLKRIKI